VNEKAPTARIAFTLEEFCAEVGETPERVRDMVRARRVYPASFPQLQPVIQGDQWRFTRADIEAYRRFFRERGDRPRR
jgi:hypothetical protein